MSDRWLQVLQIGDLQDVLAGRSGRPGVAPYLLGARRLDVSDDVLLEIDDGEETFTLFVCVEDEVRETRIHAFFRCPCCGSLRLAIVLKEMEVECIDCFFKYDEALPIAEKRRLVRTERARTRALPRRRARIRLAEDGQPLPVRARPGEGRPRPRADLRIVKDDMTIRAAFAASSPAGLCEPFLDYRDNRVSLSELAALPAWYVKPEQPASLSDCPALDIRWLNAASVFPVEGMRARFVGWPAVTGERRLLLIFDGRGNAPTILVAHNPDRTGGDYGWQRLRIVTRRNGRPSFICPVTGKASDIIYLRNRVFASRLAQRLIYPSQRARRKS